MHSDDLETTESGLAIRFLSLCLPFRSPLGPLRAVQHYHDANAFSKCDYSIVISSHFLFAGPYRLAELVYAKLVLPTYPLFFPLVELYRSAIRLVLLA